ncbi:MAG: MaoC family dehydratase N-terminal domain-containing protein [Proteobacteria bacterium]|nr:MaoC family dehydratase N-terminal domain-containing protein [Pseudomonadota bacterium]
MPIDRDKALAAEFPRGEGSYTRDDVILYHLGIGAGNPQTDPNELEYTYEKSLKVLPSFAVVAPSGAGGGLRGIPGLEFNPALLLHGEEDLEIHRPLPPEGKLRGQTRVADVYDKGKAALALLENNVTDENDEPLYTVRMSLFLRGEGGFGGPSGPKVGNEAPEREPDGVIESPTLPQQALLYRLNGDKNPLHADPEFAKAGGFDTPIIHGLCSYGIVCKAVVDGVLGGDVTRVKRYEARFRGVAFPGETYLTRYWREGEKILVEARSKQRDGAIIISNAAVTVTD